MEKFSLTTTTFSTIDGFKNMRDLGHGGSQESRAHNQTDSIASAGRTLQTEQPQRREVVQLARRVPDDVKLLGFDTRQLPHAVSLKTSRGTDA